MFPSAIIHSFENLLGTGLNHQEVSDPYAVLFLLSWHLECMVGEKDLKPLRYYLSAKNYHLNHLLLHPISSSSNPSQVPLAVYSFDLTHFSLLLKGLGFCLQNEPF